MLSETTESSPPTFIEHNTLMAGSVPVGRRAVRTTMYVERTILMRWQPLATHSQLARTVDDPNTARSILWTFAAHVFSLLTCPP
jgi:hypothetical protein